MKIIFELQLFGIMFQIVRPLTKKEQQRLEWEKKNLHRLIIADQHLGVN